MRSWLVVVSECLLWSVGCGEPAVPQYPTWVNVQPILQGECASCHGASAMDTGGGYRFDFYDMTADICGDAVQVLGANAPLAEAWASSGKLWDSITSPADQPGSRPRMPPEPAPYLADWEWKTIRGWLDAGTPRGATPPRNRPPHIQLYGNLAAADQTLDITAVVSDPDGDPVVGVLTLGDVPLKMGYAGAFSARIDTSKWPPGDRAIGTVLCDGWSNVTYALGTLSISH